MKKNILITITAVIVLSLTVYSYISANDSKNSQGMANLDQTAFDEAAKFDVANFYYGVGTRFSPKKKEDLNKITSINEFFDDKHVQAMIAIKSTSVIIIENERETHIRETGNSATLTAAQLALLRTSPYATGIKIRVDYTMKNEKTGNLEESYATPHLTIVPEKQAAYEDGSEKLVEFLRVNSKEDLVNINEKKLQPAKIDFTITKEGKIGNVELSNSCGYPSIDKKMIELIKNAPGKWIPAENIDGEKVDQKLVLSFANMGC